MQETMPFTVEALIEQVLHETASTAALENTIGAKAMLGHGASEQLWAEVAGLTLEELSALKQELEHLGVLSNAEFVHPLFREVLLAKMPNERRQGFARRALEVLKDDPESAVEFIGAANLEPDLALEWLKQALTIATETGNKIKAAQFLARSTEFASGEERGILAYEAAKSLRQTEIPVAIQLAQLALSIKPDSQEALYLLIELLETQGRQAEVDQLLEHWDQLGNKGTNGQARLLHFKFLRRDFGKVVEIWEQHPEIVDLSDFDVSSDIAWSLSSLKRSIEARAVSERALSKAFLNPEERSRLCSAIAGYRLARIRSVNEVE